MSLDLLPVEAKTERDLVIHPPGNRGIEVDGLDLEHLRLRSADPAVVVFGLEAEGRAEAKADVHVLVQCPRHVAVGNRRPTAGIATIASSLQGTGA